MSKIVYSDKLLDPRWDEKRLQILKRDEFTCMSCGASKRTLQVHHLIYITGREPWEYRNGDLLTLCESCHDWEHEVTGSKGHAERGERAVSYPNLPRPLSEVLARAMGQ